MWPQYTRVEIGGARGRQHGLTHLVHEEVRDPVADAVLRLTTAADGEELRAAHVFDLGAVAGELSAELPADVSALEHAGVQ